MKNNKEDEILIPTPQDNNQPTIPQLLDELSDPKNLLEGLMGLALAASTKEGCVKLIGGTMQGVVKGHYGTQLLQVWKKLKEEGKIAQDQFTLESFTEMIDFIDRIKVIDQERYNVASTFFKQCVHVSGADTERQVAKQCLLVTKELSSEELRILRACWELRQGKENSMSDVNSWAKNVAIHLGHEKAYLVLRYEENLMKYGLLGERVHSDRSGFAYRSDFRLTDFGIKYCEMLTGDFDTPES